MSPESHPSVVFDEAVLATLESASVSAGNVANRSGA
jgi:hypothetical protein